MCIGAWLYTGRKIKSQGKTPSEKNQKGIRYREETERLREKQK